MKTKTYYIALCGLVLAGCSGSGDGPAPVNMAPSISAIADQTIEANVQSPSINFTIMDDQTPETSLAVSVMSSDTDIVANDGLVVNGSDTARSLAITPVADTLGGSLITVVVTDAAGLSASTAFMLTVDPQQLSFQQFFRAAFADAPGAVPRLINAISFDQDATADDFADLLAQ